MANRDEKIPPRTLEQLLPKDLTEEAVANFWALENKVELHDAALLLEGVEPRPDRGHSLRKYLQGYDDRYAQDHDAGGEDEAQFVRLAQIVRRAREAAEYKLFPPPELSLWPEYDPDGTQHEFVWLREFLRWARGKGCQPPPALARLIDISPSQQVQNAEQLRDLQQAYDAIRTETRKTPSQRAVADKSGYARDTVRARWTQLRK